jgi:hypothetical protein
MRFAWACCHTICVGFTCCTCWKHVASAGKHVAGGNMLQICCNMQSGRHCQWWPMSLMCFCECIEVVAPLGIGNTSFPARHYSTHCCGVTRTLPTACIACIACKASCKGLVPRSAGMACGCMILEPHVLAVAPKRSHGILAEFARGGGPQHVGSLTAAEQYGPSQLPRGAHGSHQSAAQKV